MKKTLAAAAALLFAGSEVAADQPVKCPKKGGDVNYIGQVWTFHVSPRPQQVNLFESSEVCTHQMPNRVQIISENYEFELPSENYWKVKILDDTNVLATMCPKKGVDCQFDREEVFSVKGTWDILYQQALLVQLENGSRFVANLHYSVKPGKEEDLVKGTSREITGQPAYEQKFDVFSRIRDHDFDKFNINCDRTMVGFVQHSSDADGLDSHKVQCFYGVLNEKPKEHKEEKEKTPQSRAQQVASAYDAIIEQDSEQSTANIDIADVQLNSVHPSKEPKQSQKLSEAQRHEGNISTHKSPVHKMSTQYLSKAQLAALHPHTPSDEMDILIDFVNSAPDLGWSANECMLSKSHPKYDATKCHYEKQCENEEYQFIQIDAETSLFRQKKGYDDPPKKKVLPRLKFGEGPGFEAVLKKVQAPSKKYKSASEIPDGEIPEAFDLSNVDGYDFTNEVRDQGGCGSCYSMAFVSAVESRLKMRTGKEIPQLSAQQMMQCNYLTEGCSGGWSILHGFLAEHGSIVSEECAPYKTSTKGHSCGESSSCPAIAKISKSYMLGSTSEKDIQKEILRNGAVSADWYCPPYSATYKKGIFQKAKDDDFESLMGGQLVPNHVSVLIGWGGKGDEKYWILRNSYGQDFGLDGNMHIKRGENSFMVESNISGFDPVLM